MMCFRPRFWCIVDASLSCHDDGLLVFSPEQQRNILGINCSSRCQLKIFFLRTRVLSWIRRNVDVYVFSILMKLLQKA